MKTKKLLSILLALMMLLSVVPMYASAATALKASNVVTWPTISYKTADGKMYYGQTQEEALIINDDEVVQDANGNVVDGHFEFSNPTQIPSAGTRKSTITFIPDDTSKYTGFKKSFSSVTYVVEAVTPSYVDKINDPVVATEVEPGSLLSASILSGGAMTNPHNPEEPNLLAAQWIWSPSLNDPTTTTVSESGYYTAQFLAAEYNMVTTQVYVKIASAIPETTIAEYPTISELTYNPDVTWADIELTGGKAVIKGTETEVEGTFAIKETRLNVAPNPNFTEIEVVFTPDDPEAALPYEFTIPVKVNSAPLSFIDNEGNVVEDFTFEVEPGTKMNDIKALITTNLLMPKNAVISVEDNNAYAQNGRKYKLTVLHDDPNYVGNELYFTVKFKNVELTPTITAIGLNAFKVNCGDYKPAGTFTITCNGEEVATVKANQDFNCEVWTDNGGSYEIKAKYNPTENDYFIISDAEWAITVYAKRNLNVASAMTYTVNGDAHASEIRANDIIVAKTSYEDFAHYVIKDGSGKEIVLEGVDITSREITFAMPDHDLTIEIKTNKEIEMEEAAANCDHICHSDNPLFQMLWKVLTFIFRLFDVQQYCDCGNLHYDAPLFG